MTSTLLSHLLLYICFLSLVTARNEKHISTDLFNSLEELSRLVDISYCVGTTGVQQPFQCLSRCDEFPDLELVTTWNTGVLLSDSCGYIALSHTPTAKQIILAFRGTYSITNTIIDLSAYPQAYIPYPDPEEKSTTTLIPADPHCENCTVHAGFMRSWLHTRTEILPAVTTLRQNYPDYAVTLVGHSLGGAVAALAGLEMRLTGWDATVTTFGEPMIGNGAFAAFLDEQFGLVDGMSIPSLEGGQRFRRVTHFGDPVPRLPLAEWGYSPHSGEVFIMREGLPPRRADVVHCAGAEDSGCIAGGGAEGALAELYRDLNVPVGLAGSGSGGEACLSSGRDGGRRDVSEEQAVLGFESPDIADCEDGLSPLRWDWSLIPARYRLWELFYAHRDYFWRIGLCVPGGDPTG
ncbi:Extracellular triacylglycerol lipase, putative [Penicillium digitatum]|uniref:Extracellular triacylglycerol lipase, putative n=3 Tax=Penicillium digitatum TaxID=36651 RepID=K9FP72_PEND2|nr:Extracellular triacylglycerol lipase, putative [Penicillium digitatum Pd1]EKV08537.1 Extracellular triacylglycerol lipase, putative [Penicillium digitatum Pd1]EKV10192.1 Extracellular triacylglycerol lipase, putative [Penicillium digitatum PHI26]QQK41743.1 Extracellular triacylglycerol lipase, putative [Penicillium digitatum]